MKVRVILLQDVKSIGKKGEIVEVSRGYALNYLFPKKLAVEATEKALKELKARSQAQIKKLEREKQAAIEKASRINGRIVKVKKKAGESGKLFGSITPKELSEIISKELGIKIDKKQLELLSPIKSTGEFSVKVDLGFGQLATFTLVVEPE